MENQVLENALFDSHEKHQQLVNLVILKLAASWLEKQEWVSPPYGGQNPLQDLIFHTQLTANRIWEDCFSKKADQFNAEELKRQISELGHLTPELQSFIENRLRAKFENIQLSGI